MKFLALLMWVGQFGFSAIFPTVFFLLLAEYLRHKFGLGLWIVAVLGILGILTQHSHRPGLSAFHAEGRPGNHRQPQAPGGL